MQPPSTKRLAKQFARLLQALPPKWKELMSKLKAFSRPGKIRSPEELMRVIFLYCGADLALKPLAAELTLSAEPIGDEAVRLRLLQCIELVKELLRMALELNQDETQGRGLRFLSPDGTELRGGYRLHLVLELLSLRLVEVQVGSKDKGESLKNFGFQGKDVVVPDRGYCSYPGIFKTVLEDKADILLRWNHGLALYPSESAEEPLDLQKELENQEEGTIRTFPVIIRYSPKSKTKDKRKVTGWLHVYRMTEDEAKKSGKRTAKTHKRKNRPLSPRTVFLSGFILVFTTLSPDILSAKEALEVYRCRWQVELAIKRLKGLLELNKLRNAAEGKLAEFYIFGKLLYLLLVDKLMRSTFQEPPTKLDPQSRSLTPFPLYALLKKALDASLIDLSRWKKDNIPQALHVLRNRPRKGRHLQSLPRRAIELAQWASSFLDSAA